MIQRIQSIYLLLGALAMAALLFVDPLWQGVVAESHGWFTPVLLMLGLLTVVGGIGAIFLYNDREKQRSVVVVTQIGALAVLALILGTFWFVGALGSGQPVSVYVGFGLPVLAYVFFWLARRAIEKDIDLVKSMDRLR